MIQRDYDKENKNINNIRVLRHEVFIHQKKKQKHVLKNHIELIQHFIIWTGWILVTFNPCADKIESEEF